MKHGENTELRVGDKVEFSTGGTGTVVANIDKGEYGSGYPADEWRYLERGVLIETSFAGLVHIKDLSEMDFKRIED